MTNFKYVILWADGPCTKRVIGPFLSRDAADTYVATDPDILVDDAEVVALDEPADYCVHEPDWTGVAIAEGVGKNDVLDVPCKKCGRSGSFIVTPDIVNW